jgi:hypothetical protein
MAMMRKKGVKDIPYEDELEHGETTENPELPRSKDNDKS